MHSLVLLDLLASSGLVASIRGTRTTVLERIEDATAPASFIGRGSFLGGGGCGLWPAGLAEEGVHPEITLVEVLRSEQDLERGIAHFDIVVAYVFDWQSTQPRFSPEASRRQPQDRRR